MGFYTEISTSQYSAKDVALTNRMNGVTNHSGIGLFFSQNFGSILTGGAELITDISTTTSVIKEGNRLYNAYIADKNDTNLTALKNFAEEHPENKTIQNLYKCC